MDPTRRTILTAGVAAAAAAAAPRLFAQQTGTGKFYERGPVRIYYEEAGSGVPLLLLPGGGLNATIGFFTGNAPDRFTAYSPVVDQLSAKKREKCDLAERGGTQ